MSSCRSFILRFIHRSLIPPSVIHLLRYSFIPSFIHHSLIVSEFPYSVIHILYFSFIHSIIHSSILDDSQILSSFIIYSSFICSFPHHFSFSFIKSFIHSSLSRFMKAAFVHSSPHSSPFPHQLIPLFIHSTHYLFNRFFIQSFPHSLYSIKSARRQAPRRPRVRQQQQGGADAAEAAHAQCGCRVAPSRRRVPRAHEIRTRRARPADGHHRLQSPRFRGTAEARTKDHRQNAGGKRLANRGATTANRSADDGQ